jgi:hypothetical protein
LLLLLLLGLASLLRSLDEDLEELFGELAMTRYSQLSEKKRTVSASSVDVDFDVDLEVEAKRRSSLFLLLDDLEMMTKSKPLRDNLRSGQSLLQR